MYANAIRFVSIRIINILIILYLLVMCILDPIVKKITISISGRNFLFFLNSYIIITIGIGLHESVLCVISCLCYWSVMCAVKFD